LLEIVDSQLKGGELLPEAFQSAFEELATAARLGHQRLDPAEGLHDGLVFLFQPLETAVDLVQVTMGFAEVTVKLFTETVEPAVNAGELTGQELYELLALGRMHRASPISHRWRKGKCLMVNTRHA
jgi:hypothetical protein